MAVFFWLMIAYFLITSIIIIMRPGQATLKWPRRLAVALALFLVAFPFVRSVLSTEGHGEFSPASAVSQLEWLAVILLMGPVHLVLVSVIVLNPKTPSP
jgi:hypothetical protein